MKGKLVLDPNSPLVHRILEEYHSSMGGGHGGIQKTHVRVLATFIWPGMSKDIKHFVHNCLECQQSKYEPKVLVGLLQPLSLPDLIWDEVTMNFIIGLQILKATKQFLLLWIAYKKWPILVPYQVGIQLRK